MRFIQDPVLKPTTVVNQCKKLAYYIISICPSNSID